MAVFPITIYLTASDGHKAKWRYWSLAGAQKRAINHVGEWPEFGTGYAVAPDGVVTISASGCTMKELFPKAWATFYGEVLGEGCQ